MLRSIDGLGVGYRIGTQTFNNLTYADDTALIADSPEGMRSLLERVEAAAGKVGLSFNPRKCATLHLKGRGGGRVRPTVFRLQGEDVSPLGEGEHYEHLGIPAGFQVRQTPIGTIEEMLSDLRAVDRSLLAPWQKLDAVATFILPRLDFCLRGADVKKGPLKEADRLFKRMAKGWLHLPQRASAEVVFLPPKQGGAGLLPLRDMADVLTIAHAFKMLTAGDEMVRTLAWHRLRKTVSGRISRLPSADDVARYLSGDLTEDFGRLSTSGPPSIWSRARQATVWSKDRTDVTWRWSEARGELAVDCRGANGRRVIIPPGARAQMVARLRAAVTIYYRSTLLNKKNQGKVFEVTSRTAVSSHFMRQEHPLRRLALHPPDPAGRAPAKRGNPLGQRRQAVPAVRGSSRVPATRDRSLRPPRGCNPKTS